MVKKYRLGRETLQKLLNRKQSIVTINNKDDLCSDRALVTMRAWCHKDDNVEDERLS